MARPVAGEIVILPFPQTNLNPGKRRPALVIMSLPLGDLILCQITTQTRADEYCVSLARGELDRGQLAIDSFVRVNRLFTVEKSIVLYVAGKVKDSKLSEVRLKLRQLFAD